MHPVLKRLLEIDHDVPAKNDVEFIEGRIPRQIVSREYDVVSQESAEDRAAVCRRVVILKRPGTACPDVVVLVLTDEAQREDALPRLPQNPVFDIGRVDSASIVQTLFVKENGHG